MANSVDISSIKALIGAAKLEDAIKLTIQKGKDEKNDVLERYGILFSGRLTDLSKKVIAGTVSFDDMNREKNDIQAKLLDIIKYYENGRIAEFEHTEEFKRLPTPEEIGRGSGNAEYYKFLQMLKRFWWIYAVFIGIGAVIVLLLWRQWDVSVVNGTTITHPMDCNVKVHTKAAVFDAPFKGKQIGTIEKGFSESISYKVLEAQLSTFGGDWSFKIKHKTFGECWIQLTLGVEADSLCYQLNGK